MAPDLTFEHKKTPSKDGVKFYVNGHNVIDEALWILHQNILHQLHVTDRQTGLSERENSDVCFVTVLFIYLLKIFARTHFLEDTVFKIAEKRFWCCVRNVEFLPEFEVSSEIKIQANEDGGENGK